MENNINVHNYFPQNRILNAAPELYTNVDSSADEIYPANILTCFFLSGRRGVTECPYPAVTVRGRHPGQVTSPAAEIVEKKKLVVEN